MVAEFWQLHELKGWLWHVAVISMSLFTEWNLLMITIPGSCFIRVFGLGKTCPQSFEEPSNKILEKCGGLPLAIISVASLLACQSNRSISQWNYVFNSLRSNLSSNPTLEGMREILNLSYTHLPHHHKTCLLYIHWIVSGGSWN